MTLRGLLALPALAAAIGVPLLSSSSSPPSSYVPLSPAPADVLLELAGNQAGYPNATVPFTTSDGMRWHVAPYTTVDLAGYGVPASAVAVRLSVKAIITKGAAEGLVSVWAFARSSGAACCSGPPGREAYPIDSNEGQAVRGELEQAVAQHAGDGVRSLTEVTVPISGGMLEWSWGYRATVNDGAAWPLGDAVAINLYLDGYDG